MPGDEPRNLRRTQASATGKVVVITGANSGIGKATAMRYARGGAHVVMVCLDEARNAQARREIEAAAAPGARVDLHLADLSVLAQTRDLAQHLLAAHPQIHVLINNAGLHSSRLVRTAEGHERCWAVNHLSPFVLMRLLLERLRQSAPARVLNVNSEGHRFCGVDLDDLQWSRRRYMGLRSYGQSKTANLLVTAKLAREIDAREVAFVAMHPGRVRTNIGSNNGRLWRALNAPLMKRGTGPEVPAEALYYLGVAPEATELSGLFLDLTRPNKPHRHARYKHNRQLADDIWSCSERQAGLDQATTPATQGPTHTSYPRLVR